MNNTEESFEEFGQISVDQRKMNAVRAYFEWMPIRQVCSRNSVNPTFKANDALGRYGQQPSHLAVFFNWLAVRSNNVGHQELRSSYYHIGVGR